MITGQRSDESRAQEGGTCKGPTFWSRLLISTVSRLVVAIVVIVMHHE
ncbi:hypothetical protein OHB54_46300 (plasmid) [Streptomyces sp. NBC_01007]|nr:hypothetical protein OHB54_46300 [Streptomyces sp. NBC_01007]